VAVPLHPALQETLVWELVAVNAGGCVMVNVRVTAQLFASMMVQVYVPAHRLPAVAAVPPEGAQEYV
jgi:hypothetical protein